MCTVYSHLGTNTHSTYPVKFEGDFAVSIFRIGNATDEKNATTAAPSDDDPANGEVRVRKESVNANVRCGT